MFVLKLKCIRNPKNDMNEKIGEAIKTFRSKNHRSYITSGMGQLLLRKQRYRGPTYPPIIGG